MIAVIILMLSILIVSSVMISSNFQSIQAIDSLANSVSYKNELMLAKSSLLAASTTFTVTNQIEVNGEPVEEKIIYPALPLGRTLNGIHTLPAYLLKTKNIYQREYVYCPMSLLEEAEYHQAIAGQNYSVNIADLPKNNKPVTYVMSTAKNQFTDMNVVGFIISPHPKSVLNNACNTISYDSARDTFISNAGRVAAITRFEIEGINNR